LKRKKRNNITEGKFIGNERGFGFVVQKNGGADIFIPPHLTFGALNGDEVVCKIEDTHDSSPDGNLRQLGKIAEIRSRRSMIGTFHTEGRLGFVKAIDTKIPYVFLVPPKTVKRFALADGHRVVFSVEKKLNHDDRAITCFITEVLGHVNDPGMDVLTLVYKAGVPYEFPTDAIDEAAKLPTEVGEGEIKNRRDLRGEHIITIDGDDTKDIDDAISFAQAPGGGFHLGVHIADVTHYVRENSALDAAALERGTSIYLADRVIPMLPHKLSSGICSLFPDVDRLTLSCLMTVNKNGDVESYEIVKSVIRSKRQWTYQEVQVLLDSEPPDESVDSAQWRFFQEMDTLREILRIKRERRGALDFDLPESKIRVDAAGWPISVEAYPRTRATAIIEEFMILCNETIAAHFLEQKAPFVYRAHEPPGAEKIAGLRLLAKTMGLGSPITGASSLQRLLDAARETPSALAVSTAVLHALPQAHYSPDNPSHFGLASDAYCHFTSPIRRYADLQIHRIVNELFAMHSDAPLPKLIHSTAESVVSKSVTADSTRFAIILPAVCAQCSKTERVAEALEREVADLKKVQFMTNKEGQTFDVIVSGLTSWGIYVMLSNTVEGLIPIADLKRHGYSFDKERDIYERKPMKKRDVRAASKTAPVKTLRHGTPLKARLVRADEEERRLTFAL